MGDIAAYLKDEKVSIDEIKLTPLELSELIASIKNGTISGKIGKEVTLLNWVSPLVTVFRLYVLSSDSLQGLHISRLCTLIDDKASLNLSLQILAELIAKGGTVKAVIEEKDLVQVTVLTFVTIWNHSGSSI